MGYAFNTNRRDSCPFNGTQQNPPQTSADSSAEAALERLGMEHTVPISDGFGVRHKSFRLLEAFKHRSLLLLRIQLDDELFI